MSLTRCPQCGDQHACHSGDSHTATVAVEGILFYIGWRAGRVAQRLPLTVLRPADIQVPARDILALIQGDKTLDEILEEAERELPVEETGKL